MTASGTVPNAQRRRSLSVKLLVSLKKPLFSDASRAF